MPAWDDVKDEFAWEGSWRDICILDTSLGDWRAVWAVLRTAGLDMTYTVDSAKIAPPEEVDEIFDQPRQRTFFLAVALTGAQLNCHFFSESEIEFDLDPREIAGQAQLDAVVSFMLALATATGKFALMTPENDHVAPFLSVPPSGVAEYLSSGGFFRELADQKR